MDKLDRLKCEMQEKLQHDMEQKKKAQLQPREQRDPYEEIKAQYPGQEVYALAVGVKCPSRICGADYPIAMFATYEMGEQFHLPCRKCGDMIITLRDTFTKLPKNTFPVEKLRERMNASPGKYEAWINMLKAAYEAMVEAGKQVWDEARTRESTILEGSGSNRPVKMRMTMQTPEEALREMKPTTKLTSRHDPMREISTDGVAELFADGDVAGKFGG
jgi:hypothetical protein